MSKIELKEERGRVHKLSAFLSNNEIDIHFSELI
jgi:hypothetical protein